MSLRLDDRVVEGILRHAGERYPEECCGVLLGRVDDGPEGGERRRVTGFHAADNEREEERERRYLIGPETFLRIEEAAARDGLDVVGFYHSHPDHPAQPSEEDRVQAWPWYSYVIVSVREGRPNQLRSWRLEPDRSGFREEPLDSAS